MEIQNWQQMQAQTNGDKWEGCTFDRLLKKYWELLVRSLSHELERAIQIHSLGTREYDDKKAYRDKSVLWNYLEFNPDIK